MTWIRDLVDPKVRRWEEMYRNRWQHDSETRSTHGVNCTGGCSWIVYVKDGIVTWEMQATDYPALEAGLPQHEPRGCQRGICFSWHVYAPTRVKYPYLRGVLADLWARARAEHADPVEAWASIVENEVSRSAYQQARGKGGLRRATWEEALDLVAASLLYTAKRYGPDRVIGFSPIPAMSMVSYAAGSRFLQLFGGALLSFYDLYADFPPASPETWGEKTDAPESADWFNSKYIVVAGSNLSMTRTPDVHFAAEARHHGAKLVVLSPDFSQVSKYADWWLPVTAGMDGALFLAVSHVVLKEFHADREVPYFTAYLRRYSDAPFLVVLEPGTAGYLPGRMLRASELARYRGEEHADWKPLVLDRLSGEPRMPQGSIGFRWQKEPGRWNLEPRDGQDGADLDPVLTFLRERDAVEQVAFTEPAASRSVLRGVPVRHLETVSGRVTVTTVLDLLMAQFGVARGLEGDYPHGYDDEEAPYTPAWQERYTGIGRNTVVQLAREWATTAERTNGKCTVIIGSGVNHWYHANLHYRAAITPLVLCGCVGVNGGGLAHYTGQEKLAPAASWSALAMALDWGGPPRLQNGPSFHYVHSDQWRYERGASEVPPDAGRFARSHTMEHQVDAVRRGWLPFYPQFDRNPVELLREAERAGARSEPEVARWVAEQLRTRAVRFAVEDPDAPENWPRVWLIWRANALLSSAKGHEYFLRHYLGLDGNAVADADAAEAAVHEAVFRHPVPRGKLDLVVDVNFRMDTSALYADVVLPAATWYEKDDLNTTDLHCYIHPLGAAVPPCWESKTDWDTFKTLAERVSALARDHFPEPFREVVATPLLHDTPDEVAQPEVRDWARGECDPIPGRTMPHLSVVERDYPNLHRRFCTLGPMLREKGVEDRGVHIPVGDIYDAYARSAPSTEWNGLRMPSLERAVDAAEAVLRFAPETNGEVAWRGFKVQEQRVGLPLADLAEPYRGVSYDFLAVTTQPRRILTSPCWSGITNGGRAYTSFAINVERLVPWRTLTGRQHLYIDHAAYRAFGEALPAFKPRIDAAGAGALVRSGATPGLTLNCVTPHGKWHMHTTYYDNLRMLTLSRGVEPFWLNAADAAEIGVADNDWVEVFNDNGVVVTRAVVTARVPRGLTIFYHAPERTISFPKSPLRGGRRGGGHNSLTRMRLKPVLMVGGYAQLCYRFNDYGPPSSDRDTWVVVRRLEGAPRFY
ncbi:MAG TPA: nitrate reductase subunit alpha [Anaeromyxobacteraceae bacterium]|nr:nitrate reductase subunit alpha [Anaeromyxobacteraceae bacterium]